MLARGGRQRPPRAPRASGIAIAGKTGTPRSNDASTGTYGIGKFVSSFAAMPPPPTRDSSA